MATCTHPKYVKWTLHHTQRQRTFDAMEWPQRQRHDHFLGVIHVLRRGSHMAWPNLGTRCYAILHWLQWCGWCEVQTAAHLYTGFTTCSPLHLQTKGPTHKRPCKTVLTKTISTVKDSYNINAILIQAHCPNNDTQQYCITTFRNNRGTATSI